MALNPAPRLRAIPTARLCRVSPQRCGYATAVAITASGSIEHMPAPTGSIERYPPTQPPSYKPPDLRKAQLLRQYTSLIRSTPLTIFFQHNSLKANEWAGLRRELAIALHKVSSSSDTSLTPDTPDLASTVRLQVIQTSIFAVALRIAEFYNADDKQHDPTLPIHPTAQESATLTHSLSRAAYEATLTPAALEHRRTTTRKYDTRAAAHAKRNTPLHSLLHGPIAALTFPAVTPQHLAAALSILAPTPGAGSAFPAPRRATSPGYYDPAVQGGLQKLLLLGARVEGRAMDRDGVKWVGGLAGQGGLDGLRAQLVRMLEGVGAGVTGALEAAGKSLWVTMEGRRVALEEEEKGEDKGGSSS